MSDKLTFGQKQAARRFRSKRAEYYEDLAALLSTTNRKMLSILEADALRYVNTPRGQLSALWAQRFIDNGANLAEAWQGTLPADEVAILYVQQDAGEDAIPSALNDLAVMARLSDRVISESVNTLAVAFLALIVATVAITVMPGFSVSTMKESIEVPVSYWGPFGRAMVAWDETVKAYAFPVLIIVLMGTTWLIWSAQNWVGQSRETADRTVTLYRTLREISAVRFLMAMSTLTRKRGNVMHTLEDALLSLADSSASPWMRWRIEQVLDRIGETGATTCDVFDSGLLSQEMFWRLRDVEEGSGFAAAFDVTSKYVAAHLVPRLIKRLTVWRWILLFTGVVVTGGMVLWIQTATFEMKAAAMNYMAG